ncbi:MAG: hypothetical protein PF692_11375 [Kiritimatiellae bacterium]|jgi:hypothetical protein|nr:hypothetical protein [Kiritimatiellia bacterium]
MKFDAKFMEPLHALHRTFVQGGISNMKLSHRTFEQGEISNMKRVTQTFCITIVSLIFCAIGASGQDYILYAEGSAEEAVYINGFKYLNKGDALPPIVTTHLVEGSNSVVIMQQGGVTGRIERIATDGTSTNVCEWILPNGVPSVVFTNFYLPTFDHQWSWQESDSITNITQEDQSTLTQLVVEVISAFKNGNLEPVLATNLNYQVVDLAEAKGCSVAVQKKRTMFFYSIAMSPTSRLEWTECEGDIVSSISPYNDHIAIICRDNETPLIKLKAAYEEWYESYMMYAIKTNGVWYLQ